MNIGSKSRRIIIPTVLIITVIGTVAAVNSLFTHTFPSVTVPGVPPLVTTGCDGATLVTRAPSSASGSVQFGCSAFDDPAFSIGTMAVAVSASGSIPAGYTDLYVTGCNPSCLTGTPCASLPGALALLSSNPTPSTTGLTITAKAGSGLSAGGFYGYCADVVNTSSSPLTILSFTVTWQQ